VKYFSCVSCGLRFVAEDNYGWSGCANCGASLVCLEQDLSLTQERILRKYGERPGTPDRHGHIELK
jgi:predicted  nucleic acid-binding Zn-ribbon protein